MNMLSKQCQTKSWVALWQSIVPVRHTAWVSSEDSGSRYAGYKYIQDKTSISGYIQRGCFAEDLFHIDSGRDQIIPS